MMGFWMPVRFATSFRDRVHGLLGQESSSSALLLAPCSDVHTVGMRRAMDVAFVSRDGEVLFSERNVSPGSRRKMRRSVAVIERYAEEGDWFEVGDVVRIGVAERRMRTRGEEREGV